MCSTEADSNPRIHTTTLRPRATQFQCCGSLSPYVDPLYDGIHCFPPETFNGGIDPSAASRGAAGASAIMQSTIGCWSPLNIFATAYLRTVYSYAFSFVPIAIMVILTLILAGRRLFPGVVEQVRKPKQEAVNLVHHPSYSRRK